ncbi:MULTISPECIES: phosphatidylinositol-specific phospholipase C domain-containing protein [Flavobacterium]|uniref:1-phosphatidylinositol phosphodiesterase n=1 Tax=Flavobacterium keumense TaxID=1306518 RepID=A0ABY8N543_9FLAO|nr:MULTISPECIES: phosphatidylinositol-specific phospholipase C domain-containing protein [Flavobacterium]WGK94755.1 phosphatidylinositol-specific phospholipase C domain-containing protein [Flavobacterium keumense]
MNIKTYNYSFNKPFYFGLFFALFLGQYSCSNDNLTEDGKVPSGQNTTSVVGLTFKSRIPIKNIGSNNWMESLTDDIDIRDVSIPATHDSGTHDLMPLAKCQDLSISAQLNAGIRFLDIRVTPQGTGSVYNFNLKLSHTFISATSFNDVLLNVKQFLKVNPTETVLIKISRDTGAECDLPDYRKENVSFLNEYNTYKNNVKLENFLTQFLIAQEINKEYATMFTKNINVNNKIRISDLRGKALLFYDYSKFPKSFSKINSVSVGFYGDNLKKVQLLPTTNPLLLIQDYYKNTWYSSKYEDEKVKKGLINEFMVKRNELAIQMAKNTFRGINTKTPFSFNFISMSGVVTTPNDYSKSMNMFFLNEIIKNYDASKTIYLNGSKQLKYNVGFGITFFDFPSNDLIRAVYNNNFK